MPILNARLPARLLTLALIAATPFAPARALDDSRWYKVEVLIVAHTGRAALQAESWPPLPLLAYPEPARFLLDPQRIVANLDLAAKRASEDTIPPPRDNPGTPTVLDTTPERPANQPESEIDDLGRQFIYLPTEVPPAAPGDPAALPDLSAAEANTGPSTEPLEQEPAELESVNLEAAPVAVEEDAIPPLPVPFVLLPASEREFSGKAAYMERNGQYRILFHQTWWQPVDGEQGAVPIILDRSGDTGTYPLLQGSITLHRSRFLHVGTQLWLNTDGSYLPANWQMPAPPKGPPSLEVITPPPLLPAGNTDNGTDIEPNIDGNESLVAEPAPEAVAAATDPEPAPDRVVAPTNDSEAQEAVATAPDYAYRHAVLLQQQRRMRSDEVHYIDHPLFGVIIKLTPLDADDLAQADYDEVLLPYITRQKEPAEPVTMTPAGP